MGCFSSDMKPLIEIYQRETTELMDEYSGRLMRISQSGRMSQEDVNSIFRAVHTIKSSSAMIGLSALSSCTHRMEDLLLIFRDDPSRAVGEEGRISDILYAYLDYIQAETAAMADAGFAPASPEKLVSAINDELNYFADPARLNKKREDSPAASAAPKIDGAVTLCVSFPEGCAMANVRAFQLVKQLRPLCASLSSMPDDFNKKSAAAQILSGGLLLTIATEQPEKVRQLLSESPYVKSYRDIDSKDESKAESTAEAEGGKSADKSQKFGMVAWDRILAMQNISGELITSYTLLKNRLEENNCYKEAESDLVNFRRLLNELETLARSASMTPVSSIAAQYYRLIRDISKNEGKHVSFAISGEELELDRSLLDAMANPLIHLLRNAVDHGVEGAEERAALGKPENGKVSLSVEIVGGSVRFTVSDDGRGIDTASVLQKAKERGMLTKPESAYSESEIMNFIFEPGFTTNAAINQYSGRGVGMDVVRKTADDLGGLAYVRSERGKGSSIIMEVPVSMSSCECLNFSAGQYTCMLPIRNIESVCARRSAAERLKTVDGALWFAGEDALLPVIDLFKLFGEPEEEGGSMLIVIRGIERSAALLTGPVKGEQTAVEKPLPSMCGAEYRSRYGISGCAVTGTGGLGLVLSTELLLRLLSGKRSAA